MQEAIRHQVLVSETRAELKGSLAAWVGLAVVTAFVANEFRDAAGWSFGLWLAAMGLFLSGWLVA